jgi:hypothetical protein
VVALRDAQAALVAGMRLGATQHEHRANMNKLKEIVVFHGSRGDWERVKYQAPNLFQRWTAGARPFPGGSISQASFTVKFADSKTPRTVSIRSSTKLLVSRDHDSEAVERWLWLRHFHLGNPKPE